MVPENYIDNLIISMCEYTEKVIGSDKILANGETVAELGKALAKLVSARASK